MKEATALSLKLYEENANMFGFILFQETKFNL